jgi:epoxyqueuosine reductase QueG
MTKETLAALAEAFMEDEGRNQIPSDIAIDPAVAGMRLYDAPILGFAAADDPFFYELKKPEAVGPHFLAPREWMQEAETVIALFFPLSPQVRKSNRADMSWPSPGWIHARGEGMDMIDRVNERLRQALEDEGYRTLSPVRLERFCAREEERERVYTSNWSERHVAYICGLGTFGLSKGLITRKGVAGRFTSIVTSLHLAPHVRPYTGVYDYCSLCGACVRNCPVGAISMEEGKDHVLCSRFVNTTMERYHPPGTPARRNKRYGCGKCQVKVPCEARIPPRKKA